MLLSARRLRGFSLVELSVTLMIISITLAGALDLAINYEESDKIYTTETRIARIERAMEDFIFKEKRLPCPASLSLRVDEVNFGKGGTPTYGGSPDCPNLTTGFSTSDVYAGAVPVRDLGLSDDFLADAWERRFLYVTDKAYIHDETTNGSCNSNNDCLFRASDGAITVESVSGAVISDEAVYVIVSFGNNGLGAYNIYGAKGTSTGRLPDPDPANIAEVENAQPSAAGGAFDAVFVQDDRNATFDDIVVYRPKWRISSDAKGLESEEWTTCEAAEDAMTTCADIPDPESAPVGSGDDGCLAMAAEIYRFCIDYNGE